MKKVLLTLSLGLSIMAFGQNDLSVTLTAPAANSTVGPGIPFNFDVTITNNGTQDVTASDTVVYFPSVNGGLLTQNGIPIAWFITGMTIAGGGGTTTGSQGFAGLNIQGAPAGNITFCGAVFGLGPNWSGVTESDTTNNSDCSTVAYDPNSIGLSENVLTVSLNLDAVDNSYFANGVFHVEMENIVTDNNELVVFSITGKEVLKSSLTRDGDKITSNVDFSSLKAGVYITVVRSGSKALSTKKIIAE